MPAPPERIVLRLPRTAYLAVVFLAVGVVPIAFGGDEYGGLRDVASGNAQNGFVLSWRVIFVLVPILVAVAIARTATVIDGAGIRVRALFGSRRMSWDDVRGLTVDGHAVYAVLGDGAVRLPCARIAHLGAISRTSRGRLPDLPDVVPKPAPSRRPRR